MDRQTRGKLLLHRRTICMYFMSITITLFSTFPRMHLIYDKHGTSNIDLPYILIIYFSNIENAS